LAQNHGVKNRTVTPSSPAEVHRPQRSTRTQAALERVRKICFALPGVTERVSHGAPCFFVRDKKMFVMFMDNHHADGRLAIWCAAPEGMQQDLIANDAERFFRPPYVGHRGWIGVRLDVRPDWKRIAATIGDAYRLSAPRSLVAELTEPA